MLFRSAGLHHRGRSQRPSLKSLLQAIVARRTKTIASSRARRATTGLMSKWPAPQARPLAALGRRLHHLLSLHQHRQSLWLPRRKECSPLIVVSRLNTTHCINNRNFRTRHELGGWCRVGRSYYRDGFKVMLVLHVCLHSLLGV